MSLASAEWIHCGYGPKTTGKPCLVCGHPQTRKQGECIQTRDGSLALCYKEWVGSYRKSKSARGGWFHRLIERPAAAQPIYRPRPAMVVPAGPRPDFAKLAGQFQKQVQPPELQSLADKLGLSITSLRRMDIGWASRQDLRLLKTKCSGRGCWTFPIQNGHSDVVGLRVRSEQDVKYVVAASDGAGLSVPRGLPQSGPLILPEGPTSTAALLCMGLRAVGRPNNSAGLEYLCDLVRRLRPATVVVLGDNDERWNTKLGRKQWSGRDGAMSVAQGLRRACRDVRVALPPPGIKDARAWLRRARREGLSSNTIRAWIEKTVLGRVREMEVA